MEVFQDVRGAIVGILVTAIFTNGESISNIKNNNGLGLNENDFLSTDSNNKKKPIANHTFYGGE